MATELSIPAPNIKRLTVRVRGTTPLITHRFSEQAMDKIEGRQQGKANSKKPPRDPEAEFDGARYKIDDDADGFPAVAFKHAMIRAGKQLDGTTMTDIKNSLSVPSEGDFLPLDADEPRMRRDRVAVGRTYDIRYRPEYWPWAVDIPIQFNADVLTTEQVLYMVQNAGAFTGVGEKRPENGHDNGRFEIDTAHTVGVE